MNEEKLRHILEKVSLGKISIDEALKKFKYLFFENLGYAKVDHGRTLRKGFPETIFAKGKTNNEIINISKSLAKKNNNVMITKSDENLYKVIIEASINAVFYRRAGIIVVNPKKYIHSFKSKILIVSAGTSDINICEEAAVTAEVMGSNVEKIYDIGVSGIHRLFSYYDIIKSSNIIIVVAGMDGVLPSVIGGLTNKLVIAVPTSVGYGANFSGLAPLLTMLNTCSTGVLVVNIDNGFGAGYSAVVIDRLINNV